MTTTLGDRLALLREGILYRFQRYLGTPTGQYVAISLVYLVCISIAEAITTLVEPQLGMLLHGIVLVALLIHGSLIHRGVLRRFLILLSIAPLIRILSLSLPLQKIGLPLIYWYMVIGMLLFLAAFIAGRVTDLRGNRIGWSWRSWPLQIAVSLIGFGLGYIEYLILKPGPLAAYQTWEDVDHCRLDPVNFHRGFGGIYFSGFDAVGVNADDGKVRTDLRRHPVRRFAPWVPFLCRFGIRADGGAFVWLVGLEDPFAPRCVSGARHCQYQPLCVFPDVDQRGIASGGFGRRRRFRSASISAQTAGTVVPPIGITSTTTIRDLSLWGIICGGMLPTDSAAASAGHTPPNPNPMSS